MGSFSLVHWIILGAIGYLIYKAIKGIGGSKGKISADGKLICQNCGTRGDPQQITKGSTGIELVLWLFFLIPGLIYSIWRLSTRYPACPSCGQAGMISTDTPNGRLLAEKFKQAN